MCIRVQKTDVIDICKQPYLAFSSCNMNSSPLPAWFLQVRAQIDASCKFLGLFGWVVAQRSQLNFSPLPSFGPVEPSIKLGSFIPHGSRRRTRAGTAITPTNRPPQAAERQVNIQYCFDAPTRFRVRTKSGDGVKYISHVMKTKCFGACELHNHETDKDSNNLLCTNMQASCCIICSQFFFHVRSFVIGSGHSSRPKCLLFSFAAVGVIFHLQWLPILESMNYKRWNITFIYIYHNVSIHTIQPLRNIQRQPPVLVVSFHLWSFGFPPLWFMSHAAKIGGSCWHKSQN